MASGSVHKAGDGASELSIRMGDLGKRLCPNDLYNFGLRRRNGDLHGRFDDIVLPVGRSVWMEIYKERTERSRPIPSHV